MRKPKLYAVPAARLNHSEERDPDNFTGLHCKDDVLPIPCEWIVANASRFYFTTKQIIEAAVPEFVEPDCNRHCRLWVVYFLIRDDEIVYVGQSSCPDQRFEQHRENGLVFDKIAWVEVPSLFISDIEAYYIWRCNPIYNNKWPKYRYFGEAARLLDEKHGEKRNDVRYVTVINPPRMRLPSRVEAHSVLIDGKGK